MARGGRGDGAGRMPGARADGAGLFVVVQGGPPRILLWPDVQQTCSPSGRASRFCFGRMFSQPARHLDARRAVSLMTALMLRLWRNWQTR